MVCVAPETRQAQAQEAQAHADVDNVVRTEHEATMCQ